MIAGPGVIHWLAAAIAATVTAASLAGCSKKDADVASMSVATPGSAGASGVARPLDHLAPGELVEGKEEAFGVFLPRDLAVVRRIPPSIYGRINAQPREVAAYFEARMKGGKVTREPTGGIVLDRMRGGDGKSEVWIRIDREMAGSRVEIRDVTSPPPEDHPNDEARWRAAGLKPNGELLDPTQVH